MTCISAWIFRHPIQFIVLFHLADDIQINRVSLAPNAKKLFELIFMDFCCPCEPVRLMCFMVFERHITGGSTMLQWLHFAESRIQFKWMVTKTKSNIANGLHWSFVNQNHCVKENVIFISCLHHYLCRLLFPFSTEQCITYCWSIKDWYYLYAPLRMPAFSPTFTLTM